MTDHVKKQVGYETSKTRKTALILATEEGNMMAVDHLVEFHSDISHQDSQGDTALHKAIKSGQSREMFEYLSDHATDLNILNNEGKTYAQLMEELEYSPDGTSDDLHSLTDEL